MNATVFGLNYELEHWMMWLPGWLGVITNLRFKVKLLTQTKLFENSIMVCVIMNTVILALSGIVASND